MINTLSELGLEGTFLRLKKCIYKKPTASIILHGEKLYAFPMRSRTRQGYPFLLLLFSIVWKF